MLPGTVYNGLPCWVCCNSTCSNKKLQGIPLAFNVSFLCKYLAGGDGVESLPPIIVGNELEYEVEAQISHHIRFCWVVREFLVQFWGFDISKYTWLK